MTDRAVSLNEFVSEAELQGMARDLANIAAMLKETGLEFLRFDLSHEDLGDYVAWIGPADHEKAPKE